MSSGSGIAGDAVEPFFQSGCRRAPASSSTSGLAPVVEGSEFHLRHDQVYPVDACIGREGALSRQEPDHRQPRQPGTPSNFRAPPHMPFLAAAAAQGAPAFPAGEDAGKERQAAKDDGQKLVMLGHGAPPEPCQHRRSGNEDRQDRHPSRKAAQRVGMDRTVALRQRHVADDPGRDILARRAAAAGGEFAQRLPQLQQVKVHVDIEHRAEEGGDVEEEARGHAHADERQGGLPFGQEEVSVGHAHQRDADEGEV